VSGVVEEILVAEDETVQVGATLARIGSGDGAATAGRPAAQEAFPQQAESPAEAAPPAEDAPSAEPPAAQEAPAPARSPAQAAPSAAPAATVDGTRIAMPALGESVSEGTVTRWLKHEGETVERDEPLLEVSTDKVDTEIPSPVAGVLLKILVG